MAEEKTEEGVKAKRQQVEIDGEEDTWLFEESTRKKRYWGVGGMEGEGR